MADRIAIRGLEVECIIGVYPSERDRLQRLSVDLELVVETERAARSDMLEDTLDYEFVTSQVAFLLQNCRFRLLETAAHALIRYLLAPPTPGQVSPVPLGASVRLTKPEALPGLAVPSLSIERKRDSLRITTDQCSFGTRDVIHETKGVGIYRCNVAPGHELPLAAHRLLDKSEFVLGSNLLCQGRPVVKGSVRSWPRGAAHSYRNPSPSFQSIVCVDRSSLIGTEDAAMGEMAIAETAMDGEPAQLGVERGRR